MSIPAFPSSDRDDRMKAPSLRKNNEEVLRKAFMQQAREACMDMTHEFGRCAKEASIMVVFNCRAENKAMQDCLSREYNEETFKLYLEKQGMPPSTPAYTLTDRFTDMFK